MNILSTMVAAADAWPIDHVNPLVAIALGIWIVWWLFLVDWSRIVVVLKQGGWIALVLLGAVASLVWSSVLPPGEHVLPIGVPGYLDRLMVVSALYVAMFGCGALQMAIWPPHKS